jgi:hypothetical protein
MSIIAEDICEICGSLYSSETCSICLGDPQVAKRKGILLKPWIIMALKLLKYEGRSEAIKTWRSITKYEGSYKSNIGWWNADIHASEE